MTTMTPEMLDKAMKGSSRIEENTAARQAAYMEKYIEMLARWHRLSATKAGTKQLRRELWTELQAVQAVWNSL